MCLSMVLYSEGCGSKEVDMEDEDGYTILNFHSRNPAFTHEPSGTNKGITQPKAPDASGVKIFARDFSEMIAMLYLSLRLVNCLTTNFSKCSRIRTRTQIALKFAEPYKGCA